VYVQEMEPKGVGELQLAFEQLKKKLESEGLFRKEHKKPIPEFPEVIGVVTSPTGAAIRDIQNVITRRFSLARILLIPVRVQGNLAGDEIVNAIETFNDHGAADVLIVGRGGGSIEDLWPFNEEKVARAIFNSKIPVISAVGHEIDFTISDFVSDLRAPTPSAAAELVVKDKNELLDRIRSFILRSENYMKSDIREKKLGLSQIMKRRVFTQATAPIEEKLLRLDDNIQRIFREVKHEVSFYEENIKKFTRVIAGYSPDKRISEFKMKVLNFEKNIFSFTRSGIRERRLQLAEAAGKLDVLSPLSILKRGYSISKKYPAMNIIRSVKDVSEGDEIQVKLKDGDLDCSVKKINEERI
ncbi:MAG: exodeoxyribonuclease VII large subunit, partial [bacterium]|nr:exodeoxyribonuclease VII large subunit [bacterium]